MRNILIVLIIGLGVGVISAQFLQSMGTLPPPEIDPQAPRYLIINADDLCLSEDINKGIIETFKQGVVTSATAMMNMPNAPEMLKEIHSHYPDFPVGLHLNITTGSPVLDPSVVPSLVDSRGNFFGPDDIPFQFQKISLKELRAEITAQLELFLSTGVPLSHLDYHHNIMALYTPFFELVIDLAREYNLPVRNPVPASLYGVVKLENGGGSSAAMGKMISMGIRRPITAFRLMQDINPKAFQGNYHELLQAGIPTPHWFIDNYYENATLENFLSLLEQLPPGFSEIMVHPGLSPLDSVDYQDRALELKILTDSKVREKIKELGISLVDFSALENHSLKKDRVY